MAKSDKTTSMTPQPSTGSAMVVHDYGEDVDKGFEHQSKSDVTIPFMTLLQSNTPIVTAGERVEARPGCWWNTATDIIYPQKDGFLFVPSTTRHKFGKWTPRDKGGGFHGHEDPESEVVQKAIKNAAKFGKYKTDDGIDLVETFYVHGVVCSEFVDDSKTGDPESMAMLAFSSTKIRAYKSWMTRVSQLLLSTPRGKVRPPLYAHLCRITSRQDKNEKGTFWVPVIQSAIDGSLVASLLPPSDERFLMAKQTMELIDSNAAKIDYSKQGAADEDQSGGGGF